MQNSLIQLNGKDEPVVTGTELSVAHILERLSQEDSIQEICRNYNISREHVRAALLYAEMNLPHSEINDILYPESDDTESDDEMDYNLLSAYMF